MKLSHTLVLVLLATPAVAQDQSIYHLVDQTAARHSVPAAIAHGVIQVESGYNCAARNGPHRGIMQINTRTARGVGITGNLFNCATGLEAGMRYLRQALERGGRGCAGISLYNTGTYAKPRCTAYGRKVLAKSRKVEVAESR